MPETEDPIAALDAKDIPIRAAGARDLSLAGTPAAIPRLLASAVGDKSPGVRLAAAAAVADILSRHRFPPRRAAISPELRQEWFRLVAGLDPILNTGLFAVCGTLATPEAFTRVIVGLRDPRQDVRAGACVGLWRAVASAAYNGDVATEARVVATLTDTRIRVETRVEIARICVDVGYVSALESARPLVEQCVRQNLALAESLIQRLESPPSAVGLWVCTGLDVAAVDPTASRCDLLCVLGLTDAVLAPESGAVERLVPTGAFRVLRARAVDKEAEGLVVQVGERSYWPAGNEHLCTFGDRLGAAGRHDLVDLCDEVFGGGATALRVRGASLLARGDVAGAILVLEAAIDGKRVPIDTWWFLADALDRAGRPQDARPHLEKYVSRAAKRAPHMEAARRRLAL
ncbi:MAG: hypothetical protein EXR71_05240 [Myxococcales bacterium]|nr:hypothetical protein [Myxococcales bacterium]